jgi:two-component system, NarL family, response regulator DesR
MGAAVIRVMLVEDRPQVLHGLEMLLAAERDLRVVGSATSAEDAIALARGLRPDIIVMDIQLPGMDGIAATRFLRRALPHCRVIMLSLYGDDTTRQKAYMAGAAAFISKHDTHRPLLSVIREVASAPATHP